MLAMEVMEALVGDRMRKGTVKARLSTPCPLLTQSLHLGERNKAVVSERRRGSICTLHLRIKEPSLEMLGMERMGQIPSGRERGRKWNVVMMVMIMGVAMVV